MLPKVKKIVLNSSSKYHFFYILKLTEQLLLKNNNKINLHFILHPSSSFQNYSFVMTRVLPFQNLLRCYFRHAPLFSFCRSHPAGPKNMFYQQEPQSMGGSCHAMMSWSLMGGGSNGVWPDGSRCSACLNIPQQRVQMCF